MRERYTFVALALGVVSLAVPARMSAQTDEVNICDRTEQVRTAVLAQVTASDCTAVSARELAAITALNLARQSITSLQAGDFDGLTGLETLEMDFNRLTGIPGGVIDHLTSLKKLDLCDNRLSSLRSGMFDSLTGLTELNLYGNKLQSLPAGVFDNLTGLTTLRLYNNDLAGLPAGVFDSLTSLTSLQLHTNKLTALPADVFDNLTSLTSLQLQHNRLPRLPEGLFDGLTSLQTLDLESVGTGMRELPAGVFDRLSSLGTLNLRNVGDRNRLALPAGVFDGLTSLTTLDLRDNRDLSYSPYLLSPLTSLATLNGSAFTRPSAPRAPTNLTATFADGTIELGWTTPATGGAPTSYRILREKGSAAQEVYVDDTYEPGTVAVTFTDTEVTEGETYRYHVKALNAGGASPASNPAQPGQRPATGLTVAITSMDSLPANATFTVTITFSERVSGFALEAIHVTDGTAANLAGSAATYYAEITPNEDFAGNVTIRIAADAATDAQGRGNLETSVDFAADTKAPELTTSLFDRPIEHWTAPTDTGDPIAVDGVQYSSGSSGRIAVASDDDTTGAPGAQPASVDHARLVLAYDEALDDTSTPPVSAFTVRVGEFPRAVSAVAVRGRSVRLTPVSPVPDGKTITVSYTPPAGATASPIRDVAGNAASGFTDEPVTTGPGVAMSSARERYARVNRVLLPYAVAATSARTLAAIGSRIDSAGSGAATESRLSLAGVSMLAPVAAAAPWEINDDPRTTSFAELLGGSSFEVPLATVAGDAERDGSAGTVAVWGSGEYGNLAGGMNSAVDWSGDLLSLHVGADVPLLPELLAGVAAAWSSGGFEYVDRTDPGANSGVSGMYEIELISVHPYVRWSAPGAGLRLWATGGYGWGEVAIDDELHGRRTSALRLLTGAMGGSGRLLSADGLIAGGTTLVRLKGEGVLARVEVEGNGPIERLKLDTGRLRGAVEASHEQRFRWGRLTQTLEVAVRHDHGDGAQGAGLELGGELRYAYPEFGLTVAGHGRLLATHHDGYEEWGVGGLIRIDPGADRRGLSLSVAPGWGAAASRSPAGVLPAGRPTAASRLDAELGYGLPALDGQAVLTPYGGLSLAGEGVRGSRTGARLELAELTLNVEGTRREGVVGPADHAVTLTGRLRH